MTASPRWYSKKPYVHFDLPLGPRDAEAYVSDPGKVARHAFYPLLAYELRTPRIKKSPPSSGIPFVSEPKLRPIAYPAHKDGYIFSYYKAILETPYEDWLKNQGLGEAVTAFRAIGENNITLAKKAFDFIKANPACKIVVTDVEKFFDTLNHAILKRIGARFLGEPRLPDSHYAVYRAITHYSTVEQYKAYNVFGLRLSGRLRGANKPKRLCTPAQFRDKIIGHGLIKPGPDKGIPQGTSLSPLLSNMYMADLDLTIQGFVTSLGGKYWRYCDDILIVVPDGDVQDILDKLDHQLKLLELTRSQEKTRTFLGSDLSSHKQLQYLGFVFNGTDAVIRPSSIHRYHRKLKKAVRMAEARRKQEGSTAPLRKQALYNMYSDKPVRGKRIRARLKRRKYKGNFTHYMDRASERLGSPRIAKQRRKILQRFRSRVTS